MPKFSLIAAASAAALMLGGFAFDANAAPLPLAAGAAGLLVPVADEENAEVQNLLEPETDQGTPADAEESHDNHDTHAEPGYGGEPEHAGEQQEIHKEQGKDY
jgi:hypothetical protein